jgi:hypothetical protein
MDDHVFHADDGQLVAPDAYIIRLSPWEHAAILGAHPGIIADLTEELIEMARIDGMSFVTSPEIKLLADNMLGPRQIDVSVRHTQVWEGSTQSMRLREMQEKEQASIPDAILILNGQHIHIDRPVLNLGRHRDNHIIIDDPTVSRHHVQIRLRFGQHMLFDVSGKDSTAVNDCQAHEATLQSGDVIRLGKTNLIYVADE